MPGGALVLCAVLHLAEGPVTTYEAGGLSEARGQLQEQGGVKTYLWEFEVDPKLSLKLDSLTFGFTAGYAPRLWVTTVAGGLQALHRAAVGINLKPDPLYRIFATAAGASGTANLLAPTLIGPAGTTPGPIQPVGTQTRVRYVFGEASAGVDSTPTARTRVALSGAYLVDGGEDAAARVSLPLQRGPRGTLNFDWRMTAFDSLDGEVIASRRTFSTNAVGLVTGLPVVMPPIVLGTITETWRRKFDKELSTWAGAGIALSNMGAAGDAPAQTRQAPIVDVGVQYIPEGGQQRLRASARYGPIVDAITGRIYQRIDSIVMVTWAPSRIWRLVGELTAGLAIGGAADGQSIVTSDARVAYGLTRELELTSGVRTYWQEPPASSLAASYRQYGFFVGLSYLQRGAL